MKRMLTLTILGLLVAACGSISTVDMQATVNAQVAATVAARPPEQVTVEVPATVEVPVTVEVPLEVPVTVVVEVTSVPAATQPSPEATPGPGVSTNPQDPLAGANLTPVIDERFDFPNKYYWYLFDTTTGVGKVEQEQFTLISKLPEHYEWTFGGKKFGNFYITTKTVLPDTRCKAGDHWGLVFRQKDNANFYMFGVSCDGKYRLAKRIDGLFEPIVELTDFAGIRKLGQANTVGVRAMGDQLSLYANDQFIATVTDGTFAEGVVGLYVRSWLTPDLTVRFDDIAVYTFNP